MLTTFVELLAPEEHSAFRLEPPEADVQVCHSHPVKAMPDWTGDKVWGNWMNFNYMADPTVVYAEVLVQLHMTRCDLQTTPQQRHH